MRWSPIKDTESLQVATDPYFRWRLGGAGALRSDPSLADAADGRNPVRPVVVRLQKDKTALDLAHWAHTRTPADEPPPLRVPSFYTHPTQQLEKALWCTGLAEPKFLDLLETDGELRDLISRVAVLSEIALPDESAGQSTNEELGKGEHSREWPADSVVIGIIDFGFAFAHERFRLKSTETRIEYLWVQDAPPAQGATASSPVPYGHEITAATINGWLKERGDCMDEDVLYRRAAGLLGRGWLRSVSRRMAHGTHVLDLASGYRLDEPDRTRRPIICVQLPKATVADTSGASLDSYVLDGVRYILERADEIAARAGGATFPVVINFSSGEVAGPHDGSSDLEQAIDELLKGRSEVAPLEVVISAGNSHLGRLHAQIKFENAEQIVDLPWRVLPDDRTPSFLEIWLPTSPPPKGGSRIKLQVTTPGGSSSGWLHESTPGAETQLLSDDGEVLGEARYCYIDQPTKRGMFLVALQPTRRNDPTYPRAAANAVAPSGTWIVRLVNTRLGKRDEPVEAWIQWDDVPLGFPPRGRQSYFDEECYERFDAQGREIEKDLKQSCYVKRAGSMNAIATGAKTIVVGGSLGDEVRPPAKYSAGGPITRAAGLLKLYRHGPDVTAVSDDSSVHLGVLAAGTRSGSVVAMNGTSVAAPQVTRLIARDLATPSPSAAGIQEPGWQGGRVEILKHVPGSQVRSAARGHGQAGEERIGAGCVRTERSPGAATRGARRFEKREQASSRGSAGRE